jgi:hypothetical protein
MLSWGTVAHSLFRSPDLTGNARRTFRLHLSYAVLDAAAGGILLNIPLWAFKTLGAPAWQLPLRELYSGIGMIASLYLGSWMASRRKMPFLIVPGVLAGISLMVTAQMPDTLLILTVLGISALFEILTRPAITTVLRQNYPVEKRGYATGAVRKWSSLGFLTSSVLSAVLLHLVSEYHEVPGHAISGQIGDWLMGRSTGHTGRLLIVLAGLLSFKNFLRFRQIRVEEDHSLLREDTRPEVAKSFRDAVSVLVRDGRYRRYLVGCFLDGFCQAIYLPLLWAFFSHGLGFGYVGCNALVHSIPAFVAFLMTGSLGRLCDRSNPWISWALMRSIIALDALILVTTYYVAGPLPVLIVLPFLSRTMRGAVQGGWWIMWWQIGVTHFARPGEDTSRYMGIMVFLHGAIRLGASGASILFMAWGMSTVTLLLLGGLGGALSALYSLWMAWREKMEHRPGTMSDFERQFSEATP